MNEQDKLEDQLRQAYKDEITWKERLEFNSEIERFNNFMKWIAWTIFVIITAFVIYLAINLSLVRTVR